MLGQPDAYAAEPTGAYEEMGASGGLDGTGAEGPASTVTTPPATGLAASGGEDSSGDAAGTPPNLVASTVNTVTTRRGGGGDGERDANDPIQIPDLPAPLLIYTADMRIEVPAAEVVTTIERIIEGAVSFGGYLAGRTDSSVSVRVPSRLFRESLADVEQLGDVKSRQVTAQDVSEEYHDLDVRLRNLRGLRERLESFLARATTIEEALRVQTELERVAMQIDQAEGRLRYLRSRIAFSLVTIYVDPAPVIVVPQETTVVVEAPPPPPPARLLDLPIQWLNDTGLGRLLDLT
ncbi:MAG: DUF4349 domain-containing protein [Deltaproteobacteria bacterium]|nr:DUF4349 domain-containing protein [Deltaproteobacteria bacterium]